MLRSKIFGPPGTGKTTYLLSLLEDEFTRVHPSECAFVSFTRKGTYEGAERAMEQFNLERNELTYFKTIHALCFACMGARRHNMIQKYHFKQFSDALGLKFLGYYTEELSSGNDQYLFAEQLSRNNPAAYEKLMPQLNVKLLQWVVANYRKFKKQLDLLDFTDLLENYVESGEPLPIKVAFIDEAQDLTSLQWQVVHKMFSKCERLYIAGDDDQAIYEWSGADVEMFLKQRGRVTTLSHSYRLPDAIHAQAQLVAASINYRQDKKFTSNGIPGVVEYVANVKDVDFSEETLILARNRHHLNLVEAELQLQGVLYIRGDDLSADRKVMASILKYEQWRRGECSDQDMALYGTYFKNKNKGVQWYDAINLDHNVVNYYRRLIAKKADLTVTPLVELSTIHSSKGSERDHVVLLLDISQRVALNLETNSDAEMRCLYVGVTRAKKKLTLVLSQSRHSYPNFKVEA